MLKPEGREEVVAGEVSGRAEAMARLMPGLCPFDHGGDDGATGEVAPVEEIAAAAAVGDLEELVAGVRLKWASAMAEASSVRGSARGNSARR